MSASERSADGRRHAESEGHAFRARRAGVTLSDRLWGFGFESRPRSRQPFTALRYSAATGDATLGELAEWDPKFAEPFALGDLISASGLSERRDFPSK